jgi:uroporphyrinogen-III synthase
MVEALGRAGVAAIAAPMLDVIGLAQPVACVRAADPAAEALILTSAKAARALGGDAEVSFLTRLPVFAVGEATASAARLAGFTDVHVAGGDADALADRLIGVSQRRFVHVAGRDRTGDIAGRLRRAGKSVAIAEIYRAEPAKRLPDGVATALAAGEIWGLVVASARTAAAFAALMPSNGGLDRLGDLVLVAISEAAAAPLVPYCRRMRIASVPDGAALFASAVDAARELGDTLPPSAASQRERDRQP